MVDNTPDREITLEARCVLFLPGQAGLSRTIQRRLSGDVERGVSGYGSENEKRGCDRLHKLSPEILGGANVVYSVRHGMADSIIMRGLTDMSSALYVKKEKEEWQCMDRLLICEVRRTHCFAFCMQLK